MIYWGGGAKLTERRKSEEEEGGKAAASNDSMGMSVPDLGAHTHTPTREEGYEVERGVR